jgi:hypothetical protein
MHDISELIYILIEIFVEGCCVENFIWEMSVTWSNLVGESHKSTLENYFFGWIHAGRLSKWIFWEQSNFNSKMEVQAQASIERLRFKLWSCQVNEFLNKKKSSKWLKMITTQTYFGWIMEV